MSDKKRMIENFEVIHSLQIGAREVVVGVSPEQEFMCCFCTQDGMNEYYAEAMASDDYLEIMELYTDRLKGQVAALQAQRNTLHIPLNLLNSEQCFPLNDNDDITGKVVAVKPSSLRYEYRRADCQLILVTNGSGARGYSRGTSVYGPGDTGTDHGGAGRGTHFDKLRPCVRPKPSAAILDKHPRRGAARGSGPYPVRCSGERPAAP